MRPEWDSPSKKIVCLFIFIFISFGLRSQSPGFTISTTTIIVAENASSDTFTIRLNKAPTTNVVLAIQVSDTTEISVSTTTLTFTSTNWSLAQTVTVTGVNDADRDGDIIQDLIVTVVDSMSDDSYDPLADERISVRTQDDDVGICATTPIDLSDFNYVGTATSSGSAEISLTTYTLWKNGAAWYTRRLDLREDFSLNFDLYFGQQGPAQYGADGIAFVIQNIDTGQGSAGEGIGYGGISPSYAIEFDTFQNGYDPADDHIAFIQNGQYNSTSSDTDSKTVTNIENVQFHNTIISWDYSESRLSYQFNHSNGTTYTNSKTVDLIGTVLSSDVGYWGFTSATGGFANYHTVRFTSSSTLCLSNEILPPTGSNTQTFCLSDAPTLNDIALNIETGTDGIPYNLVWFSTSTGSTTYLPLNTPLVDGTTYYAEAANFSDPTFANYRQSATRTSVLVNLIDPGFSVVSPSFSITEGGSTTAIEVSLTDQPSST
ncbi:MAG: lectin-like domain-containing protein, partial [Flavobacteriaceae bacterium]